MFLLLGFSTTLATTYPPAQRGGDSELEKAKDLTDNESRQDNPSLAQATPQCALQVCSHQQEKDVFNQHDLLGRVKRAITTELHPVCRLQTPFQHGTGYTAHAEKVWTLPGWFELPLPAFILPTRVLNGTKTWLIKTSDSSCGIPGPPVHRHKRRAGTSSRDDGASHDMHVSKRK